MNIFNLIEKEDDRQKYSVELIASENFTSKDVRKALGSRLTNKYSEGTPGKRYYGGNEFVDQIEIQCQELAKKAFKLSDEWHVNCQPLSGTPANFAVMTALLQPGDVIMGLDLPCGGHLSHGYQRGDDKKTAASKYFTSKSYKTNLETGLLDYDEIERLVWEHKPKLLICGGSAYPREWDYSKFRKIADLVGAYLLCDMAHTAGLILTGALDNPFPYCDVVTTTTHKTLRGPRSALIFCKKDLEKMIDDAVFPGCQGGPHNNNIAAVAIALGETLRPDYTEYINNVVANSSFLAGELIKKGYKITTDGTDNHLFLWDLRPLGIKGSKLEKICDHCAITLNKNTVPGDKSALSPGGVRIGTPAMTTRGWYYDEMEWLAEILDRLVKKAVEIQKISGVKLVDFVQEMKKDKELDEIRFYVQDYVGKYYLP